MSSSTEASWELILSPSTSWAITPKTPAAPCSLILRGRNAGQFDVLTTDFASFAVTPNQRATANLLNAVQLDPGAANFISFLDKQPFASLPADFNKISPDVLSSLYEIGFSQGLP